jgi:hypothetical protein
VDVYALERDLERRENEPMDVYVARWKELYLALSLFYNDLAFKRRRLFLKRANQGEFDRALNAYLNVCGTNISTKHTDSKLIFIFGDADFGPGTWSSFTDYAVEKLKSLGHFVVFEDEWGSSKNCPCCHNMLENVAGDAKGTRIKYCRSCHIYWHRDTMAGENMIFTWRQTLLTGQRPKEYTYQGQADTNPTPNPKPKEEQEQKKRKRKGKKRKGKKKKGLLVISMSLMLIIHS